MNADELNESMDDALENSPLINAVGDAFPALTIEAERVDRPGCEPGGIMSALVLVQRKTKEPSCPRPTSN